jgi:predicted metal-dependent enzyme (double-stranded beta helix superfamily)
MESMEALIGPIERAVKTRRSAALAGVLSGLRESGVLGPDLFAPANEQRYARRLVWRDPEGRFVAIAMTWARGQASSLHDHAGRWGAEIVVDGVMNETPFELLERNSEGRYRFRQGARRLCHAGAVGLLVPPREYHDFGNAGEDVAHTFHVYSGELLGAQTFTEGSDGWWTAQRLELSYDA